MHSDKDVAIQFKFTVFFKVLLGHLKIVAIFIEFKHDRSSSAKDLINKILEVESSFQVIAYTLSLLQ